MEKRLAVIGGGAAGLAAAIKAAQTDGAVRVTVLEALERPGKRLLATGNGRCNLTNAAAVPAHYGCSADFAAPSMQKFPPERVLKWFASLGLLCAQEDEGRVYPYGRQAAAVLDCLRFGCERLGVEIRTGAAVGQIRREKGSFRLSLPEGESLFADAVILAAGGRAAPALGGSDSGSLLAQPLGHGSTSLSPALVPLKTDAALLRPLKGIRVPAQAALLLNGKPVARETGEIQFTEQALSGIAVMQLSRAFVRAGEKGAWELSLRLLPEYSDREIGRMVRDRASLYHGEPVERLLSGLVNKRVGQTLVKEFASLSALCETLSDDALEEIARRLGDWRFPIRGTLPWAQAQVTCGGLRLEQFDPATLESRLTPGFYAAGEVLDVDGPCGGFNLQWAWCSGLTAGEAAVRHLRGEKK